MQCYVLYTAHLNRSTHFSMHTDNLPTAHIIHSVYAFHIDMKMCADITDNMVIIAIANLAHV